jgi:formate hydrogenlyase subunit 6/NADH:ubiquinone oxidoreductase subunit I
MKETKSKKLDPEKVMERIAEANRPTVAGVEEKDVKNWVTIHVMGRGYSVPADLTILTAMEYAGYKFIRGCGCRQGFCGACSTVFRRHGEYKLQTGMACQTRVEDGMYLVQIPFSPAEKASYDISKEAYRVNTLLKHYPEVARCVACNTCTKACTQDLQVMDYIQAALRGDFETCIEESFDCIQCGMCALRCPAEIVQYNVAQLARRLYGRNDSPEPKHLKDTLKDIDKGKYVKPLDEMTKKSKEELEKLYYSRERESD